MFVFLFHFILLFVSYKIIIPDEYYTMGIGYLVLQCSLVIRQRADGHFIIVNSPRIADSDSSLG